MLTIKFQNEEYILVGESLEEGGSIVKLDDYKNGRCSFAHLYPDGNISRFGIAIGKCEDIEITGECNVDIGGIGGRAFAGLMTDESWPWNRDRGE